MRSLQYTSLLALLLSLSLQLQAQSTAQMKEHLGSLQGSELAETALSLSQSGLHPDSALIVLDFVIEQLQEAQYDSLFNLYWAKTHLHMMMGRPDAARINMMAAQAQAQFTHNPQASIGHCYSVLGALYLNDPNSDSAAYYFTKGLEAIHGDSSIKAQVIRGNIIANQASLELQAGRMINALKKYQSAYASSEVLGDTMNMITISLNMASIFLLSERAGESLLYTERTLAMIDATNKPELRGNLDMLKAMTIMTSGSAYMMLDSLEQAIGQYQQGIALCEELGHASLLSKGHAGLANALIRGGEFQSAEDHLSLAQGYDAPQEDVENDIIIHTGLGAILANKYQNKTGGLEEFGKAVELSQTHGLLSLELQARREMRILQGEAGMMQALVDNLERIDILEDSIADREVRWAVEEYRTIYELDRTQFALREAELENQVQEATLSRIETQRNASILTAVLVLLGIVLVSYFYQKLKRSKTALDKAHHQLKRINEGFHHQSKNYLSAILEYLRAFGRSMNSEENQVVDSLTSRVSAMAELHEQMYTQSDLFSIDFRPYLRAMVERLEEIYDTEVQLTLDTDIRMEARRGFITGQIINELLTNSFKHAWPTKDQVRTLSIAGHRANGHYLIQIKDNGRWRAEVPYAERGHGYGSSFVRSLAEGLEAVCTTQSGQQGTEHSLQIPQA